MEEEVEEFANSNFTARRIRQRRTTVTQGSFLPTTTGRATPSSPCFPTFWKLTGTQLATLASPVSAATCNPKRRTSFLRVRFPTSLPDRLNYLISLIRSTRFYDILKTPSPMNDLIQGSATSFLPLGMGVAAKK